MEAAQLLRELAEAVPYRIHTMLTDNSLPRTRSEGIQLTTRARDIDDGWHIVDRVCEEPCSGAAAAPFGGSSTA